MKSTLLISQKDALSGRATPIVQGLTHFINNKSLDFNINNDPNTQGFNIIELGMGCFWGAERLFWSLEGVYVTAVGYGGGYTPNPTYDEVCSGMSAHVELVRIMFDPTKISMADILKVFFEKHDPTQGNRQGNDQGTQYRSAIYVYTDSDLVIAQQIAANFERGLVQKNWPALTTEIAISRNFYFAEAMHQQYLAKNTNGYCGIKGTGVVCHIDGF